MTYPQDLRYTTTHEWVRLEGDLAVVGITEYAVEQLGDVVFVDLPEAQSTLDRGGRFGEVESTKTVSDLIAPVSGTVVEVNSELADSLDVLKESAYEGGWMIKIKIAGAAELDQLMDAPAYEAFVAEEEEH